MLQGTESYYINQLKRKLEEKIDFQILQFYDCRVFSEKLGNEKISLSAHTLSRFFGLNKKNHLPYTSTLNLLSNFLGFESFAYFCNESSKFQNYLLSDCRDFSSGGYSFTALELAILSRDWKSMQTILESFDVTSIAYKNDMAMFLGNVVRQHPEKDDFLKALVEIENGRKLFYESFVDEDDPGNYYAEALNKYYLKIKQEIGSKLFNECFVNSKKIYLNQNVALKDLNIILSDSLPIDELHFHQISRLFEMRILIDRSDDNFIQIMDKYIGKVLDLLPMYETFQKSWILARVIKALAFTGKLKKSLKIEEFSAAIYQTYLELNGEIESIADLILQLTVYVHRDRFQADLLPLVHIQKSHLNETNARIAIESATAYLFAEKQVKAILDKNLIPFSQKTGNSWIKGMITKV